ncbi:hypothetical protein GS943_18915 [Rhodococcus hoagii]|nr:hypothetical protein [Prescottella equi]
MTPTSEGSCTLVARLLRSRRRGRVDRHRDRHVAAKPVGNIESATAIANVVGAKVGSPQSISAQVTPGNAGGTGKFKTVTRRRTATVAAVARHGQLDSCGRGAAGDPRRVLGAGNVIASSDALFRQRRTRLHRRW